MQTSELSNSWGCLGFCIGEQSPKCESVITQLYRFFSQNGTLLYVGISLSALSRYRNHKTSANWWLEISSIQVVNYPSKELAVAAEKEAIISERPLYNQVYTTFKNEAEREKAIRAAAQIGRGMRWPAPTQQIEYEIAEIVQLRSLEKQMLIDDITEYGVLGDETPDEWIKHTYQFFPEVNSWEKLERLEVYDLLSLQGRVEEEAETWCRANPLLDWR